MVCSGKSIECKSTALRPVALHVALTPKLNCIFSAPQGQLLISTSRYSPRHLPIYSNAYFSLKCLVTTRKGPVSILPWPSLWPSTSSFYVHIIFRICSLCLHPDPGTTLAYRAQDNLPPLSPIMPLYDSPAHQADLLFMPAQNSKLLFFQTGPQNTCSLLSLNILLPALFCELKGPLLY